MKQGEFLMTQVAMADALYMSPSSLSDYVHGRREGNEGKRKAIAGYLEVSYDDMLNLGQYIIDGKKGEDWANPRRADTIAEPESSNISPIRTPHNNTHQIPIISWVQAGLWQEAEDPFQPGQADDWITTIETSAPSAFALIVQGDSMEPEFTEDDIITIDPNRSPENGNYIIAKNGSEATFKQLALDGNNVFLKPLNSRYPIQDMTGVEFKIVDVVVEKRKRPKAEGVKCMLCKTSRTIKRGLSNGR